MKVIKTPLIDLLIIEPHVFNDERGFFFESWNERALKKLINVSSHFVQDNHSRSTHGVLRGLHYQVKNAQGKLVRVTNGSVYDVAIDLRKSSTTFGEWFGIELSYENHRQLWIPPGFAHGFVVLSETADLLYKVTNYYDPNSEYTIKWNDPSLNIKWPLPEINLLLSNKDMQGVSFSDAKYFS